MTEKKPVRYVKSFVTERTVNTQSGSFSYISVSLNKEDFNLLPTDKYGNVKLKIKAKKEVDDHGNTHYIEHDDFVPKSQVDTSQVATEIEDDARDPNA